MIKMIRWKVDGNVEEIKSGRDEGEVGGLKEKWEGHEIDLEGRGEKEEHAESLVVCLLNIIY